MEDDRSADGEGGLVTVSGLYTQNPLQRSVSQLIDKKDEESWEPHFRRLDSGLVRTSLTSAGQMPFLPKHDFDNLSYVCQFEGEEFVDTIKGFSTVRKEHTMFTDTNL